MIESGDDIIMQRNEELTNTFLQLLGDGRLAKDVIGHAASLPCSRFWITPYNAYRHIRLYINGKWGKKSGAHRMQVLKIEEIIKRCKGNFSIQNITRVVESPAPCFYLERGSAINIVFTTLRKRRERKCLHKNNG